MGRQQVRRWLAVVGCVAVLGAATACSAPPQGIDGDLTNTWDLPLPPVQWRPINRQCSDKPHPVADLASYTAYPCSERHVTETFFVGDLPGAPVSAAAARPVAFAQCTAEATRFVGDDWHAGRLQVTPVMPGEAGWKAGARWFACDIAEETADGNLAGRDGSLQGALTGAAALRLRCFNPLISGEDVRAMTPVGCNQAHHAEYAGIWTGPNVSIDRLAADPRFARGCRSVIARWTGLPDDGNLAYRIGYLGLPPYEAGWELGDRSVRCYLWLSNDVMRGSYRGAGAKKLPIHYA